MPFMIEHDEPERLVLSHRGSVWVLALLLPIILVIGFLFLFVAQDTAITCQGDRCMQHSFNVFGDTRVVTFDRAAIGPSRVRSYTSTSRRRNLDKTSYEVSFPVAGRRTEISFMSENPGSDQKRLEAYRSGVASSFQVGEDQRGIAWSVFVAVSAFPVLLGLYLVMTRRATFAHPEGRLELTYHLFGVNWWRRSLPLSAVEAAEPTMGLLSHRLQLKTATTPIDLGAVPDDEVLSRAIARIQSFLPGAPEA